MSEPCSVMEAAAEQLASQELLVDSAPAEEPQEKQLVLCRQPAAAGSVLKGPRASVKSSGSAALRRYQHYAQTLGRDLALLLLCRGTSALVEALRVSYRLTRMLSLQLHHWLTHSPLPKAAVAVLARVLRSLRALLQQHVVGPLGRLLTQLVWVQVQLSTDDVLDEGTRLSARINSCVSLLFGSIRLRSHSCLQLAAPSRQPVLAPEFSLSSPAASPTRQAGALRAQQQQRLQQRQQEARQLQRAASTPTPNSSPRGTRALAGTAAAPFSSRRRPVIAGSASSSSMSPFAGGAELGPAERASVARALRFSQHPAGAASSLGPDSEVRVLCSSELRTAILAFLQAHSRRNGSEFVLLRNFITSAPTTPTAADTPPTVSTPTAETAATAKAAAEAAGGSADTQQLLPPPPPQQQPEAGFGGAPLGFDVALGFEEQPGCGSKAGVGPQPCAQIFALAADGSSGGGWQPSGSSRQQQQGPYPQDQQQQPKQQPAAEGPLPLLGGSSAGGSLTLSDAWQQLKQKQPQDTPEAAPVLGQGTATSPGSGSGSAVLANAATLLAAAAEAHGDQHGVDSPLRSDSSPAKPSAVRTPRTAAADASADSSSSGEGAGRSRRGSFVSAADKFRSLAASAAASDRDSADPCSRPLMAFSRSGVHGVQSPGSPVRRNSGSGRTVVVADTGSQQYARLFPPGSRSFEALSLRKSGGNSPIGTPACHARHAATFAAKKKLPAAPFSLSASLPLSLDGEVLHGSAS